MKAGNLKSARRSPKTKPDRPNPVLHKAGLGIIVAVASILLLANLGQQCLWQDEAQTALIAGTVLTHGIPLGHDGRNSFSQDQGRDFGPGYVWLWHPWLQFYVLAGFFAVFGKSTLAARLPFALFGIATVIAVYYLGLRMWKSRTAGLLSAALLATNVAFLVLARQCRYYAPNMFFAALALYGYCGILEGRKRSAALFAVSAVLLFHTHYVHYAALLAAVIIHAALWHRDRLKPVVLAGLVTAVLNAPWAAWFWNMSSVVAGYGGDRFARAGRFALKFAHQIDGYIFPAALLAAALGVYAIRSFSKPARDSATSGTRSYVWLIVVFAAANIAAVSFTATFPFFRLLAPLIPVAAASAGGILVSAAGLHRKAGPPIAALILVLLVCHPRMPDYLYELTHDYVGPVDGIVKFLRENARPGDVVAVSYEDLPIKFYTNLRVVGGLTGEDLEPARKADWVILRRSTVCEEDTRVRDFLWTQVVTPEGYEPIVLDCPDIPTQNREDPALRLFRTAEGERLIIWRKPSESD